MRPPRAIFVFGYTQEDGVSRDLFPQADRPLACPPIFPSGAACNKPRFTNTPRLIEAAASEAASYPAPARAIEKMAPLHQMAAERLDETSVKTIQTKVNNKLDPAVPVRTHTTLRVVPCGPRAQHEPPADVPTRQPRR